MSIEEDLKLSFKEPLSLIITLLVILIYVILFLVYAINIPQPSFLNMSPPLLYTLLLWIVLIILVFVAAWRIWR